MSPLEKGKSSGDDRRFDLLVDGELDNEQRGRLLAGLDDEPGGWRRCALAFLQAQAWTQDLGATLRESVTQPSAKRDAPRHRSSGYGGTLLAMAACFLVALFLGLALRGTWGPPGPTGPRPADLAVTEPAPETLQGGKGPLATPGALDHPEALPDDWQWVRLAPSEGSAGGARSVRIPAARRETFDRDWLESLTPAIPADILQAFQRSGHQVRRHRELVPYRMEDGSKLVVPMESYDVHYVGRPAL